MDTGFERHAGVRQGRRTRQLHQCGESAALPKTTVSRKVQDLETRLGAQLLHRTTRKLGLTEAGNIYFEHCQRIARELDEAESAVGQLQSGPRGWLRVTAPYSLGTTWIAPLLGEFHARHPEVRVELLLSNEPLDLIAKEIDVALRVGDLPDSNLVARKLAIFRTQVYASPAYIERHGEPLHPDDLQHHRALAMQKSSRTEIIVGRSMTANTKRNSSSIRSSLPMIRHRCAARCSAARA